MRPLPSPDRSLGAVLFVDVAGRPSWPPRSATARFRELIDGFHQLVGRQLDRYQGRLVDTAGDGALALFDSPARVIACAEAVRDGVRALGCRSAPGCIPARWNRPGGEVRDIALHTGARVAALAGPGEIRVSRTIRDPGRGRPGPAGQPRCPPAQGRTRFLGDLRGHQLRTRPARAAAGPPGNRTTRLAQAAHPVSSRHWRPITDDRGGLHRAHGHSDDTTESPPSGGGRRGTAWMTPQRMR